MAAHLQTQEANPIRTLIRLPLLNQRQYPAHRACCISCVCLHVQLPHRLLPLLANAPLVFYDAARHVGNPLIRHSTGNPSPGATELHIAASQGRLKGLQSLTHLLR